MSPYPVDMEGGENNIHVSPPTDRVGSYKDSGSVSVLDGRENCSLALEDENRGRKKLRR